MTKIPFHKYLTAAGEVPRNIWHELRAQGAIPFHGKHPSKAEPDDMTLFEALLLNLTGPTQTALKHNGVDGNIAQKAARLLEAEASKVAVCTTHCLAGRRRWLKLVSSDEGFELEVIDAEPTFDPFSRAEDPRTRIIGVEAAAHRAVDGYQPADMSYAPR